MINIQKVVNMDGTLFYIGREHIDDDTRSNAPELPLTYFLK